MCAPCNRKEKEVKRKRGRRRRREMRNEGSREGTSEKQRGSYDGELVGLAVCCPMTEFIASFSLPVPRNREPSMIEQVVRRDSLFH